MSLSISGDFRNEAGEEESIELEPGRELLGFEDNRHLLWGAPIMCTLGLAILPSLAEYYGFELEGNELASLKWEAETVRDQCRPNCA